MAKYSKEEIDEIFRQLNQPGPYSAEETPEEEYIPTTARATRQEPPIYIPTPKKAGPKPLTIEEYKKRQKNQTVAVKEPENRRRQRAGKAVRQRQERAELHRIITITTDRHLKRTLIQKLKEVQHGNDKFQRGNHLQQRGK